MSMKQLALDAVASLPDEAGWNDVSEALLKVIAEHGSENDIGRLYSLQPTTTDLMAFFDPKVDFSFAITDVISDAKPGPSARDCA